VGDDALHRRLRELFSLEHGEAVAALSGGLLQLEAAPDDVHPLVVELFRTAHSIKGAAMSAGVDQAAAVARELEQWLAAIRDGALAVTPDLVQQLLGLVDRLVGSGHLERRPHPADRRSVLLVATPGARQEMHAHLDAMHRRMREIAASVPPEARPALVEFLGALTREMEKGRLDVGG